MSKTFQIFSRIIQFSLLALLAVNTWADDIHLTNCSSPELTDTSYIDDNKRVFWALSYNLSDHTHIVQYDDKYLAPGAWHTLSCDSGAACQIHITNGHHETKLSRVDRGTRIHICQSLYDTNLHYSYDSCPSECSETLD